MASVQSLDRKDATKILYKIYKKLREGDITLRFNRKLSCAGEVHREWAGDGIKIIVDPTDTEFVSTLLHEALHVVYPHMLEHGVIMLEKRMMKLLTDRQLANLIKRFADILGGN